jgi:hypothetical protein
MRGFSSYAITPRQDGKDERAKETSDVGGLNQKERCELLLLEI